MNHGNIFDFRKNDHFDWLRDKDLVLNIIAVAFFVMSLIIIAIGSIDYMILLFALVTPVVSVVLFRGQKSIRNYHIEKEIKVGRIIKSNSCFIDSDIDEFFCRLYEEIKPIEDIIIYYKTKAVVSIFAYCLFELMHPRIVPIVEQSKALRAKVKDILVEFGDGLNKGKYHEIFHALGDLTLTIIQREKNSNRRNLHTYINVDSTEFQRNLSEITDHIISLDRMNAKRLCEKMTKELVNWDNSKVETPWAALILRWIYITLYNIPLKVEIKSESGIFFASVYELLAYDIIRASTAYQESDWYLVEEVISDSFRKNRKIPRFAIQKCFRDIY